MAHSQDVIGWTHCVRGSRRLKEFFILSCKMESKIEDWMQGFIMKLLEISHSQWIYCNLTKYYQTNGTKGLEGSQQSSSMEEERGSA